MTHQGKNRPERKGNRQSRETMKKEKYISEKKRKNTTSWIVKIPYYDRNIRKTYEKAFSEQVYGSKARTLAIYHRNEMLAEFQRGWAPTAAPTVGEFFARKFELFPCRFQTKRQHQYFYDTAIKPYGNIPIDQIKSSDVQISINQYASTHTRAMTSKLLSVWRQIFKAAQLDEIRVADKTVGIVLPKDTVPPKPRKASITNEEFERFCQALLEYREYDEHGRTISKTFWGVLQVMYHTGIRPAEAFALQKSDCDLRNRQISITKSVGGRSSRMREIVPAKTANSIRSVPISNALLPIITDIIGSAYDFLFTVDGELIDTGYFSNYLHLVSLKCGVEFRAYMLRHKFATDLQKTESPRTVQDLMGHASFSMSVEYARSTEEERAEAVNRRMA